MALRGLKWASAVAEAIDQRARPRVVVVGCGDLARRAVEAAKDAGQVALWLDPSKRGEDLERGLRTRGGDARQVLIALDDPDQGLALAAVARAAAPEAQITVLLNDAALAEAAAVRINHPRTRVLSAAALSARALHGAHPPFLRAKQAGHSRLNAVIVGFGHTGQAVARDLILNCRTTDLGLPRITVIDPKAAALEAAWRARAPELDLCAEMAFLERRLGAPGDAAALAALGLVTVAYACCGDDADSLAAASALGAADLGANLGGPPIFVRLRDAAASGGAIPFGETAAVVAASEFLSPAPDAAARNFSNAYRATLSDELRNDPQRRSSRPWDELDETFRQATREAVAHIPAKLASAGIDPELWVGAPRLPPPLRLFRTTEEREALAALEHERWNAQRRMEGWRWADLPDKDEAQRLHPDLVAYDRLPETSKAHDRAMVEETQAVCRRVATLGAAAG
ncbi:MAG: hypothetical protein JSR98_04745 [Proteobacteria bacterium]|nr:hypothetical protein [Pseudomonadota bacterium]